LRSCIACSYVLQFNLRLFSFKEIIQNSDPDLSIKSKKLSPIATDSYAAFTAGQPEFLERPQKTAKAGINFLRSSDFLAVGLSSFTSTYLVYF
jgi:hypothetical protein